MGLKIGSTGGEQPHTLENPSSMLEEKCTRWQLVSSWIMASVLEVFAFLISALLYPVGWFLPKVVHTNNAKEKKPILLVHGYLHNASGWFYLLLRLKLARMGPVYTMNLGWNPFRSIKDYAKAVEKVAAKIKYPEGKKELRIVAHSMGGVVSSLFAVKNLKWGETADEQYERTEAKDVEVTQIITIASPLKGTPMARLGIGLGPRDMRTDSALIAALGKEVEGAQESGALKTKWSYIAAQNDIVVFPKENTYFGKERPSDENFKLIKNRGHLWILISACRHVLDFLRHPSSAPSA